MEGYGYLGGARLHPAHKSVHRSLARQPTRSAVVRAEVRHATKEQLMGLATKQEMAKKMPKKALEAIAIKKLTHRR